jgi:hypothetical protein
MYYISNIILSTEYIDNQNLNEFYHALHLNILQEYVEASRPHAVNTAWAMLTLVYGGQVCIKLIRISGYIFIKLLWSPSNLNYKMLWLF